MAVAKVRSRAEGAARPLDEADKKLLNLMQSKFPIAARPYAAVAELAGMPEAEVLARVQALLDDRIIRQVTPIYDTRAFGYGSMLVAARSTPSTRGGRPSTSTRTPASATTTCATTTSTCGSPSPSRRTRSSACRGRSTSSRSRPARSRSASCRR
jgi:DNA-binding Lrp family transcriptional regulator